MADVTIDDRTAAFSARYGSAPDVDWGREWAEKGRCGWMVGDTFDVLDAEGMPDRTVFHCFTGGADEARRCVERGAYLSFSGIVTFPTANDVREAAAWCPGDRIVVETDAPFLAPVPHRGKPNSPALVAEGGRFVAVLRGEDERDFARRTTENACLAFPGIAP